MTSSKSLVITMHPVCAESARRDCAQVLSPKHAAAFANGMEYFNTYGGCTAAGAAGSAVLRVLQGEQLAAARAQSGAAPALPSWRPSSRCASLQLSSGSDCPGCEGCNRLRSDTSTCLLPSYEEQVRSKQQLCASMSMSYPDQVEMSEARTRLHCLHCHQLL